MKLRDCLKQQQGYIKIGCQQGNGFVYIGKAEEYNDMECVEKNLRKMKRNLVDARQRRRNGRAIKLEEQIRNFRSFYDREVIEIFRALSEDVMCNVIMIEGKGNGKNLLICEAEKERDKTWQTR